MYIFGNILKLILGKVITGSNLPHIKLAQWFLRGNCSFYNANFSLTDVLEMSFCSADGIFYSLLQNNYLRMFSILVKYAESSFKSTLTYFT